MTLLKKKLKYKRVFRKQTISKKINGYEYTAHVPNIYVPKEWDVENIDLQFRNWVTNDKLCLKLLILKKHNGAHLALEFMEDIFNGGYKSIWTVLLVGDKEPLAISDIDLAIEKIKKNFDKYIPRGTLEDYER